MVYNTYGRYSMYMYYIVYCQEIAHYSLKNPKKNKKQGSSVYKSTGGCGGPCVRLDRNLSHTIADQGQCNFLAM